MLNPSHYAITFCRYHKVSKVLLNECLGEDPGNEVEMLPGVARWWFRWIVGGDVREAEFFALVRDTDRKLVGISQIL